MRGVGTSAKSSGETARRESSTSSPDSFLPDHFALRRSRAWLKGVSARRLVFRAFVCLFQVCFLSVSVSIYNQVLIFSYPFARHGLISVSMLPRRFFEGNDCLVMANFPVRLWLRPVRTTPGEFENGGFTLKMRYRYIGCPCACALRRRNFKTQHRPFFICVSGKLHQENHVIIVTSSLSKSSVFNSKCLASTPKRVFSNSSSFKNVFVTN